jgi:SOS-response transcriptional repressor LexA
MTRNVQNARRIVKTKRTKKSGTSSDMETPASRLRRLRIDHGFKTAADACRYFGWKQGTYDTHENGARDISKKAAQKYAAAFGTTIDYLLTGKRHTLKKNGDSPQVDLASQPVPILSWSQIGSVNAKDKMLNLKTSDNTYVSSRSKIRGTARVIVVEDNSAVDVMRSQAHSIYPGDEVFIDTDAEPNPGNLVVAFHPQIKKAAPRLFTQTQGDKPDELVVELVPLNPLFPKLRMMPGDGSYICGVVTKYMRSV